MGNGYSAINNPHRKRSEQQDINLCRPTTEGALTPDQTRAIEKGLENHIRPVLEAYCQVVMRKDKGRFRTKSNASMDAFRDIATYSVDLVRATVLGGLSPIWEVANQTPGVSPGCGTDQDEANSHPGHLLPHNDLRLRAPISRLADALILRANLSGNVFWHRDGRLTQSH